MFTDGNRPNGFYGEVYDRSTNARDRFVGKPLQTLTRWENEAISKIVTEELLKVLKSKYN